MKEFKIILPINDNDGIRFSDKIFKTFESLILNAFDGFTLEKSTVLGSWKDKDILYTDESRVYYIAMHETQFNKLTFILKIINKSMKQKSFYVAEVSNNVMFI